MTMHDPILSCNGRRTLGKLNEGRAESLGKFWGPDGIQRVHIRVGLTVGVAAQVILHTFTVISNNVTMTMCLKRFKLLKPVGVHALAIWISRFRCFSFNFQDISSLPLAFLR